MKRITRRMWVCSAVLVFFLWGQSALAADRTIDCDAGDTIEGVDNRLRSGDTLLVSGTCNEHVTLTRENITLNGGGTATISGPDPNESTLTITAKRVTIRGFTITGGSNGVLINSGGMATIRDCTVENTGSTGIAATGNSNLRVVDCTIQNTGSHGIVVAGSSAARIGFLSSSDTVAGPNLIQNNTLDGIIVRRGSTARIVGNTILSNGDDGIQVLHNSTADISDNDIDNNGDEGIVVSHASSVQLGADTGAGIFQAPNRTDTTDNGDNGIRCFNLSVADGRLGTLAGVTLDKDFAGSCVDSLLP